MSRKYKQYEGESALSPAQASENQAIAHLSAAQNLKLFDGDDLFDLGLGLPPMTHRFLQYLAKHAPNWNVRDFATQLLVGWDSTPLKQRVKGKRVLTRKDMEQILGSKDAVKRFSAALHGTESNIQAPETGLSFGTQSFGFGSGMMFFEAYRSLNSNYRPLSSWTNGDEDIHMYLNDFRQYQPVFGGRAYGMTSRTSSAA